MMADNEYRQVCGLIYPKVCRTGWRGIYDILYSMIARKPLLTLVEPLQISFYVKGAQPFEVEVSGVRLEGKDKQ